MLSLGYMYINFMLLVINLKSLMARKGFYEVPSSKPKLLKLVVTKRGLGCTLVDGKYTRKAVAHSLPNHVNILL